MVDKALRRGSRLRTKSAKVKENEKDKEDKSTIMDDVVIDKEDENEENKNTDEENEEYEDENEGEVVSTALSDHRMDDEDEDSEGILKLIISFYLLIYYYCREKGTECFIHSS